MVKVLVTGAAGYIGGVATKLLLDAGFEVVALDNFSRGFKKPLEYLQEKYGKEKFRFYEIDLVSGEIDEVFEKEKDIKFVIHFAALCSVGESVKFPDLYFKNIFEGSKRLFEAMEKADVSKLVFSSTCAVYGESLYLPIDESHPRNPLSPYGQCKKQVEDLLLDGKYPDFNFVILRYFNVCGALEDGSLGDAKKPSIHLVQNAVKGALGLESFRLVFPEVDTPDKSPIRDYVDVCDLAMAHIQAVEYLLKGGKNDVFNLGTGSGYSVLEIIKTVEATTGKKISALKGETRQGDPARLYADSSKAKKILGWTIKKALRDSIENLVKWYKSHPDGWEY